ncbi:hypothetical protein RRG08_000101 [Elysia crispata]|uniref:Uncharacterized protein n=1 Tax=Elysia crispata TaxID=231223 RepID=A0AAE0XNM1_9GAST|nr:hypothetical protein RRG08_000101 [Elysia crispata]
MVVENLEGRIFVIAGFRLRDPPLKCNKAPSLTWRGFSYIITGHRTTMEGDMERFLLHHYRSQNHNGGRHGEVSPTSLQVTEPQWRATWRGFSYIITGHRTTMEGEHKRSEEELE